MSRGSRLESDFRPCKRCNLNPPCVWAERCVRPHALIGSNYDMSHLRTGFHRVFPLVVFPRAPPHCVFHIIPCGGPIGARASYRLFHIIASGHVWCESIADWLARCYALDPCDTFQQNERVTTSFPGSSSNAIHSLRGCLKTK